MSPHRPFLVDLGRAPECCTNDALEVLHKAMAEEPPTSDPWREHPNPFIRGLIERFTQAGLQQLEVVQQELAAWLAGERTQAGAHVPPVHLEGWRMNEGELSLVRLYLEHLPTHLWKLADYSLLVDFLVQRYLPDGVLFNAAEALVVRSALMGKAQAKLGAIDADNGLQLGGAFPPTVSSSVQTFQLGSVFEAVMEYGRLRACESVAGMSDALRHRLKWTVLDHQQQVESGSKPSQALTAKLFDGFGLANLDWRRIAITEAGEMHNQGMVASMEPGARMRRLEAYDGACAFCRRLDGRIFGVTVASDPHKDGDTQIWAGKTNQGRSASPFKREGGVLVERSKSELWWCAAGCQHPHCRGTWHVEAGLPVGGDPTFQAWLDQHLAQGRTNPDEPT